MHRLNGALFTEPGLGTEVFCSVLYRCEADLRSILDMDSCCVDVDAQAPGHDNCIALGDGEIMIRGRVCLHFMLR